MSSTNGSRLNAWRDSSDLLITPDHPLWEEFLERLCGPSGLDVRQDRWNCSGGEDKPLCRRILLAMGRAPATVAANLAYFERHGGYCDCEVWMNVEESMDWDASADSWEDG